MIHALGKRSWKILLIVGCFTSRFALPARMITTPVFQWYDSFDFTPAPGTYSKVIIVAVSNLSTQVQNVTVTAIANPVLFGYTVAGVGAITVHAANAAGRLPGIPWPSSASQTINPASTTPLSVSPPNVLVLQPGLSAEVAFCVNYIVNNTAQLAGGLQIKLSVTEERGAIVAQAYSTWEGTSPAAGPGNLFAAITKSSSVQYSINGGRPF